MNRPWIKTAVHVACGFLVGLALAYMIWRDPPEIAVARRLNALETIKRLDNSNPLWQRHVEARHAKWLAEWERLKAEGKLAPLATSDPLGLLPETALEKAERAAGITEVP